ncbi:MAG: SprT family zinc-dependent metalloprotease [Gammaproteobacteria bacterium]|nr:SprT family zinc-dependent metalloprotease [Gammaproteobacteria bacterium]
MRAKSVYSPPSPLALHELNYLLIDNRRIEIRMRSGGRRRTRVMFSYHPDGILFVDAPANTTDRTLRILIHRNEWWLRKEIEKYSEGEHVVFPSKYETGQILYFLGDPTTLRVRSGRAPTVRHKGSELIVKAPDDEPIQNLVHEWYREVAHPILLNSVRRVWYSTRVLELLPKWRHKFMSSKWGSCSSKGTMNLNTHLVKVPQKSIDMVVLHELCHFRELNHGPKFYELMDRYMPDWKLHDSTLTKFQGLLQEPLG